MQVVYKSRFQETRKCIDKQKVIILVYVSNFILSMAQQAFKNNVDV